MCKVGARMEGEGWKLWAVGRGELGVGERGETRCRGRVRKGKDGVGGGKLWAGGGGS